MENFDFHNTKQPVLSSQFLSASHRSLFFQRLNDLTSYQQISPEYQAVLFILTSDDELYEKMGPYFSSDGFRSSDLFNETDFSGGYATIARAAADLFGQDYDTSLSGLVSSLDHDLFHTFLQALIIRKYGVNG
ncbi:hypothetical protein A1A1_18707 [Planococcus antarcticus DSM 14505]|uniref:Uncharacterized protein n=1 Tax=Planococcus antarcticus DSM 14505 TaxID=1185653 RepID=A0AA87IHQ4_9BACL|nr:hypothetical protein [Planococcus antarcticus]EIM04959.1 hypothetical protein A1A1_18707 [Planococcus antarcticus DSM 14505]